MTTRPRANTDKAMAAWTRSIEKDVDELIRRDKIHSTNLGAVQQTAYGASASAAAVASFVSDTVTTIAPVAPSGLTVSSSAGYDSSGLPVSYLAASWGAVSQDVTGGIVSIDHYEVWTQNTSVAGSNYILSASTAATSIDKVRLQAGSTYNIRLRVRDTTGKYSDFGVAQSLTATVPAINTLSPSRPTLTTVTGTIRAHWDGLLSDASAAPNYIRGVIAQVSTGGGSYVNAGQTLTRAGDIALVDVRPGTTYSVRFVASDAAGALSSSSSAASITVSGVASTDLTPALASAITTAQSTASSKSTVYYGPTAPSAGGYSTNDLWFDTSNGYAVSTWNGISWVPMAFGSAALSANSVTASKIAAGAVTTGALAAGSVTAANIAANSITTTQLTATAIDGMTITGATLQTTATPLRGVKLTSAGLRAYDSTGNQTVSIDAATGNVVIAGLTATSATVSGTINATSGTFSGSIAVTGTLTGGTYRSAASGQRVELNGTSMKFYSPSGVQGTIEATDTGSGAVSLLFNYNGTSSPFSIGNKSNPNYGVSNWQGQVGEVSSLYLSTGLFDANTGQALDYKIVHGTASFSSVAIGANQNVNITFPTGLFTSAPKVMVETDNARVQHAVSSLTTSGATISCSNWSTGATPSFSANWVAIGI